MTNEQIRNKINSTEFGRRTLIGFERTIGEIEFYKNPSGYFCQPKEAKGFSDDALNQMAAKSVSELMMFLYGVLSHYSITRRKELVPKTENEDTIVDVEEGDVE